MKLFNILLILISLLILTGCDNSTSVQYHNAGEFGINNIRLPNNMILFKSDIKITDTNAIVILEFGPMNYENK